MFAAVVLCLIGMALAQQPRPCTSPPQWEARVNDYNEEANFGLQGKLSYDSVYRRERLIEEVEDGSDDEFYDRLALFNSQIEFIYNFKTKNCSRQTIQRPWRDFGIQPDASSYGEAYIGSSIFPDTGLLVTIWGGNFTVPSNDTFNYVSTWTYTACIPVSRTTFSAKYGVSHLSFFDVTAGISDPDVFIPRRECLTNAEWENRQTIFGLPQRK